MFGSVVFVLCLFGLSLAGPAKLPEGTPVCKRSDPHINECLVKAVQASLEKFLNGVPKLGIFPLDPLKITALDVAQGNGNGPVAIDLKFRDLVLSGIKNVQVTSVKSDIKNYKIEIEGQFQAPLEIDSQYELKGKILVLPLVGTGKSHLVLDNVKAVITIIGKELIKDGQKYMQIEKFDVQYETSKLQMNFEGLLSQDKSFGDNLNTFLNENWEEIHKEVQPGIREALGAAFKEIASRVFTKVPFDKIFLP